MLWDVGSMKITLIEEISISTFIHNTSSKINTEKNHDVHNVKKGNC